MGVMLSLDRQAPARSRRQGQHARSSEGRAGLNASAGFLRRDAAGSGRHLSRLAMAVLAGRRQPAARPPLAGAARLARTRRRRARHVDLALTVSVPCLLGHCQVTGDGPGCQSGACAHDCHRR
jgi:hypothetical protein